MFESLTGVVDGINSVFLFSAPYTAGTVAIFLNGQLITDGDGSGNPWTESDPATGEITLEVGSIPNSGAWGADTITGFAMDTTPDIGGGSPVDGVDCLVSSDGAITCTVDTELDCITAVIGCS